VVPIQPQAWQDVPAWYSDIEAHWATQHDDGGSASGDAGTGYITLVVGDSNSWSSEWTLYTEGSVELVIVSDSGFCNYGGTGVRTPWLVCVSDDLCTVTSTDVGTNRGLEVYQTNDAVTLPAGYLAVMLYADFVEARLYIAPTALPVMETFAPVLPADGQYQPAANPVPAVLADANNNAEGNLTNAGQAVLQQAVYSTGPVAGSLPADQAVVQDRPAASPSAPVATSASSATNEGSTIDLLNDSLAGLLALSGNDMLKVV
jgi:hypothetical protein